MLRSKRGSEEAKNYRLVLREALPERRRQDPRRRLTDELVPSCRDAYALRTKLMKEFDN
jgi:hypothetical protein